MPSMLAVNFGVTLGACNVVFIALALMASDPTLDAGAVFGFGIVPGIVTGAVVGMIAAATRDVIPRWARALVLAVPALLCVVVLAQEFELLRFVPHASIPTLVCVLMLERGTRAKPEIELPDAAARFQAESSSARE